MRRLPVLLALSALSCNSYDLYRVAGYEQANFSNEADIIFVVDNSPSMVGESEALALNFQVFLDTLVAADGGEEGSSVADAVGGYVTYVTDRGALIDYQLGITTTSVDAVGVPGEVGELLGSPTVIARGDANVEGSFIENLVCEAVCWKECTYDTEREETGDCIEEGGFDPDDLDEITIDYLHDTCGVDQWVGHCGSGNEEPIEAALLSLCRAVENPPDFCFDNGTLTEADVGSNQGLLREGATALIVLMTDEGDSSRRMVTGDTDVEAYLELFDQFDIRYRFAVIGPPFEADSVEFECIGGAQPWGVERMYNMAEATEGFYRWLWGRDKELDDDGNEVCTYEASDFSEHLQELGQLLNSLLTYFPLQSVPDPSTIRAFVNDEEVAAAALDDAGDWTDGWSYEPAQNAIEFHGEAVPDYNADVQIYYQPLEGQPRELPF